MSSMIASLRQMALSPMMETLRKLTLSLNIRGQSRGLLNRVRRMAILVVKMKDVRKFADGIAGMAEIHEREIATWVGPEAIAAGQGGRFDACDLRHYLALAERAGVPAIPAHVILTLSDAEMTVIGGTFEMPDGPLRRRLARLASEHLATEGGATEPDTSAEDAVNRDALIEKLHAAMDDVPAGWMVRHVRCGPSTLKALAGCGAAGPDAPETRFSSDLEVGPGWIRNGNRRRVDASDFRLQTAHAEGPNAPSTFVARPWVTASRWAVGPDPHRHGTPFAGKGMWPAEWRCFIRDGRVTGVSSYYAWCGSATPENARMALAARDAAQRIVDEAARQKAIPAMAEIEFLRDSPHFPDLNERFPRDSIACTLDFIETAEGLQLLEGGPAFTRVGGGHPCGFAGLTDPEGVAFRLMPDVLLADHKTWRETDRTDCVLDWDAVVELAARAA